MYMFKYISFFFGYIWFCRIMFLFFMLDLDMENEIFMRGKINGLGIYVFCILWYLFIFLVYICVEKKKSVS